MLKQEGELHTDMLAHRDVGLGSNAVCALRSTQLNTQHTLSSPGHSGACPAG